MSAALAGTCAATAIRPAAARVVHSFTSSLLLAATACRPAIVSMRPRRRPAALFDDSLHVSRAAIACARNVCRSETAAALGAARHPYITVLRQLDDIPIG